MIELTKEERIIISKLPRSKLVEKYKKLNEIIEVHKAFQKEERKLQKLEGEVNNDWFWDKMNLLYSEAYQAIDRILVDIER